MAKQGFHGALRYPLTFILGSEARVKVLRELFRHGRELSVQQLVMRTGLAQSSVRESLIVLGQTMIVDTLGNRKSRLYRVNHMHAMYKPVDTLFEAEEQRYDAIIAAIKAAVPDEDRFHFHALWLFGSVTQDMDTFMSDVDLAIVADQNKLGDVLDRLRRSMRSLDEKYLIRTSLIGLTIEDLTRLRRENDPFLRNALGDAIPLFGHGPDDLPGSIDRSDRELDQ